VRIESYTLLLHSKKKGRTLMNRSASNWYFIIIFALTLVCAENGGRESMAADSKSTTAKPAMASYTIGAGDVLRIVTWKEADFTLDAVLVRTDGKISFPLLNDVQAAGLTPMMLKDVLETGLKKYVSNPVVTVTVTDAASHKFYILGEVPRTGEYPIIKDLSVLQAFALAGGFTEWASKDEIILIRREGGQKKVYKIDYKDMARGKNLEQDLLIRSDDTIIVP
jgi:polysaccharide export outer membrane protein